MRLQDKIRKEGAVLRRERADLLIATRLDLPPARVAERLSALLDESLAS